MCPKDILENKINFVTATRVVCKYVCVCMGAWLVEKMLIKDARVTELENQEFLISANSSAHD